MSSVPTCQCGQAHRACTNEFQYAVKIVCGEIEECQPGVPNPPVAPGLYFTAINIHNPDKCQAAHFRWKVVIAAPLDQDTHPAAPVYQRPRDLGPDLALEIDCRQVMQALPQPKPVFVKGYVVIESDIELDVVAVYSGTQGAKWPLNSFHTERVPPRCVPVCEDLVLPLHTGLAKWVTVAAPSGSLGPVVPLNPHPAWLPAPFGSAWVSQHSTDSTHANPSNTQTIRSYELCFDLCFGFTPPLPFKIQVISDDSAQVFLTAPNLTANFVGNVPTNTLTTLIVNPQHLRPGRNCFRIDVTNISQETGNPSGFALAGILHVVGGKCPCAPLPIAAKSSRIPTDGVKDETSGEGAEPV